jgi:hypothetical protein
MNTPEIANPSLLSGKNENRSHRITKKYTVKHR